MIMKELFTAIRLKILKDVRWFPGGFEKDRETLRYLCPAKYYGVECQGKDSCPLKSGVRIPLSEDRRVFTPVARSSAKWKKLYDKRTSVVGEGAFFQIQGGCHA